MAQDDNICSSCGNYAMADSCCFRCYDEAMTNLSSLSQPTHVLPFGVLDVLSELRDYADVKHSAANDAYERWMETGKGDEEILLEREWICAVSVEAIERVIEYVEEEMNK